MRASGKGCVKIKILSCLPEQNGRIKVSISLALNAIRK